MCDDFYNFDLDVVYVMYKEIVVVFFEDGYDFIKFFGILELDINNFWVMFWVIYIGMLYVVYF